MARRRGAAPALRFATALGLAFQVFGPNDATCSGPPAFTSTTAITGNGAYTSGPFTTTVAGTYRFIAAYGGDANNTATITACGDPPGETVAVTTTTPTLTTEASAPVDLGAAISDTATLSGGVNPTGTITFALFGPANPTCTGTPIFTSTTAATGNGSYHSGSFTTSAPGTYRFIAA